jgi:hypothetical protein
MLRRIFLVSAVTVPTLFAATLAQALSHRQVSQTTTLAELSQTSTYPQPGSSSLAAGTVSGGLGKGATIQTTSITGHPNPRLTHTRAPGAPSSPMARSRRRSRV